MSMSMSKVGGVGLHLTQLKVKQLAEELSERGATKSGRKRALQLRLRALIIAEAIEDAVDDAEQYTGVKCSARATGARKI